MNIFSYSLRHKKNLHGVIGFKVKILHSKRYPLSCMRSDHLLSVSLNYQIDKESVKLAGLGRMIERNKDAIIEN